MSPGAKNGDSVCAISAYRNDNAVLLAVYGIKENALKGRLQKGEREHERAVTYIV